MSEVDDIKVELSQGNATVARLVRAALEREGFAFVDDASTDLADLLIADVDSDVEVDGLIDDYEEAGKSVLVSGLRQSREDVEPEAFLERPFSMSSLVHACRKVCGVGEGSGTETPTEATEDAADNSDLFMDEEPEDLEDSGPSTREMEDEEAGRLEAELGLQSGKLRDSSELAALQDDREPEDVVEIDSSDSIVLDVDDLEEIEESGGGRVRGEVAARAVDLDALQQEAEQLGPPPALTSNTASQTMPDAPAIKSESSRDTQAEELSGIGSSPKERRPTTGLSRRRRSSHGAAAGLPDQLVETLSMTSDLIAKHWNAVSLAARPADRAERIERVILAALRDGPSAAEDELRRIPVQDGFSGSLGSWGLRDVLMVLIFRRLRGRLEVSIEENDYVLFIDHGQLDEIENLAGDNDRLLLEMLRENEAISEEVYGQLDDELDQELSAPLEMKLRSSSLVEGAAIQQAKRDRARRLFASLVASGDTGWFAFMRVGEQHGHSWPVNPLELGLDELMSQNTPEEQGGTDDDETVSASQRELPALDEDDDPSTREVPDETPEPEPARRESASDNPDGPLSSDADQASESFQGETRESAPWEMELPAQSEPSQAENDDDNVLAPSKAAGPSDKDTVESGATDISLPEDADEFFGESRELDELLKSVVEESDAEVNE